MLSNLSKVTQPVRTDIDPGQDVSEVCSLSQTKLPFTHGSECPGFFRTLGPVSKPSPTKLFAEASGNQIWAALSGGQFLSQERRQNAVSLKDSDERMSKENSCTRDTGMLTRTHTHTPPPTPPAHLRPLARPWPSWVSEPSPGVCAEDTSPAGLFSHHGSHRSGPESEGAERNLASGSRGAATPHRQPAQLSAPEKTGRLGDVTDGVPGSS